MSENPLQLYRDTCAELTAAGAAFAIQHRDDPVRRVFAGTPATLNDFFTAVRQEHAGQDFLEYQRERWTFSDTFDAADNLAAALAGQHGIAPGDVVGLAMRNLPEWYIAFFALVRIGAVVALLNSRGSSEEIAYTAQRVDCRLIIADDPRDAELQGRANCLVMGLDELREHAAASGPSALPPMPVQTPDDPAIILFTSGTTGRPKGATMTHRNMCLVAREGEFRREVGLAITAKRLGHPVEGLASGKPALLLAAGFPDVPHLRAHDHAHGAGGRRPDNPDGALESR